jgi:hypothetical protein
MIAPPTFGQSIVFAAGFVCGMAFGAEKRTAVKRDGLKENFGQGRMREQTESAR